ncbi:exosortase H [Marinicella rhabdoformis]|uniref:exosortase H n=1 Tax=Marinicella rhabdoformis TaxID=2580566 RepID=UPI0012AEDC79|nr:exosortase H [Marinicella rhabdoformis]
MIRFTVIFLFLLLSLFLLNITEDVRQAVILPFTSGIASFCSWLVQLFDADVVAQGDVIRDIKTGLAIQIAPGCNGVEALIIMFSAIMAFPSPWVYKLKGILLGFIAIQGLNTVRIISLFYLLQWDKDWFEWFHLYLWQALIILDALVVWLVWLRYLPKKELEADLDGNQALA